MVEALWRTRVVEGVKVSDAQRDLVDMWRPAGAVPPALVDPALPDPVRSLRARRAVRVEEVDPTGRVLWASRSDGTGPAFSGSTRAASSTFLRWVDGVLVLESALSDNQVEVRCPVLACALVTATTLAPATPPEPVLRRLLDECARAGLLAGGPQRTGGLTFHERLFHQHSRLTRGKQLGLDVGATHRGADAGGGPAPLRVRRAPHYVPLPEPAHLATPLTDALAARRSARTFATDPLPTSALATVLGTCLRYSSTGVNSRGYQTAHRAVPSASGLHELEAYVVCEATELARGLYHYDPATHALGLMSPPVEPLHARLLEVAARLSSATPHVPALLLLTARTDRMTWKYTATSYALSLKHVGAVLQAVQVTAVATGLGACPLGNLPVDDVAAYAGLDPEHETPVGEMVLGVRA